MRPAEQHRTGRDGTTFCHRAGAAAAQKAAAASSPGDGRRSTPLRLFSLHNWNQRRKRGIKNKDEGIFLEEFSLNYHYPGFLREKLMPLTIQPLAVLYPISFVFHGGKSVSRPGKAAFRTQELQYTEALLEKNVPY